MYPKCPAGLWEGDATPVIKHLTCLRVRIHFSKRPFFSRRTFVPGLPPKDPEVAILEEESSWEINCCAICLGQRGCPKGPWARGQHPGVPAMAGSCCSQIPIGEPRLCPDGRKQTASPNKRCIILLLSYQEKGWIFKTMRPRH